MRTQRPPAHRASWCCGTLAVLGVWGTPAGAELRDPTAPPRAPAPAAALGRMSAPVVSVTAVFVEAGASRAIVNGRVVRPGDVVSAVEIVAVDAGGVRYRRNGELAYAQLARPRLTVKAPVEERNP